MEPILVELEPGGKTKEDSPIKVKNLDMF